MITVLGHTAAGKTAVAAQLAQLTGSEVISADSRQVYRAMDLGTGKDYDDYLVNGEEVAAHLIDIHEPGYHYNVFEFREDFIRTFEELSKRGVVPVLCGGSGLYIEAILRDYRMADVPVDEELRQKLEGLTMEELGELLARHRPLHNSTDTLNRKRLVRAIEIALYEKEHPLELNRMPEINSLVAGISFSRDVRRQRITSRLEQRLEAGMVDEVNALLDSGLTPEQLDYYGLEYRYLSRYLSGELSYDEMFAALNTAIHRFAKRQMTYFRGMEKRGVQIHWLDEGLDTDGKVSQILEWYSSI